MSGYAVKKDGDRVVACRAIDGPDLVSEDFPNGLAADEVFWPFEYGPPPPPVDTPLTQEELAAAATLKRDELLTQAALRIAPLQDAADLGVATATDTANLTLWKQYRVDVNRVSGQPGFPATIDWPLLPA